MKYEDAPSDLSFRLSRDPGERIHFIDKFIVPRQGITEFMDRVYINRNFIRTLPGFIRDDAYERTDSDGNLIYITVAVWEDQEALNNAKKSVQAEYQKQKFDMAEMFQRLNITMDRGIYNESTINVN